MINMHRPLNVMNQSPTVLLASVLGSDEFQALLLSLFLRESHGYGNIHHLIADVFLASQCVPDRLHFLSFRTPCFQQWCEKP